VLLSRLERSNGSPSKSPVFQAKAAKLSTVPELTLLETPVMLNLDSVSRFCLFRHFFPDRIDVGSVKIASAVPTPTPN
jgi:hypothetical protein